MTSAHDTRLEVGGDLYWIRRDFDLMRRIEQAFGPLAELDRKLRTYALTAEQIVDLLRVALKAQDSRPPDDDIREHVLDVGVPEACDQLALLVMHLFSGNKHAVAWLEAEARKAAGGDDDPPDPPTAASSPSVDTSRRPRTSAGRRRSSGAPATST